MNFSLRTYGHWLLLFVITVGLALFATEQELKFHRTMFSAGDWWLVFTSHWAHNGAQHAIVNLIALIIITRLFASYINWLLWWLCFVTASILIILAIYFLNPDYQSYAGLSGLLHAFFIVGSISLWGKYPRLSLLLLAGLLLKLVYEIGFTTDRSILVDAHLYGALSGLISYALFATGRRVRRIASTAKSAPPTA